MSALDVNFWDDDAAAFIAVTPSAAPGVNFWDDDALALSPAATTAVDVNFWDDDAIEVAPAAPTVETVNFWDDDAIQLVANLVPAAVGVNFWDECEPAPATPPAVTVVSPAAGTAITAQTYLVIDITDDSALFRRIIVTASFPLLDVLDVVHDGDRFGPAYSLRSTREVIPYGFRYTLLRNGGWPASPTIVPYAIDREGNENP